MPLPAKGIQRVVSDEHRLRALVEVIDCISCHTDLEELFRNFASRLRPLVWFEALYVSLYDPVGDVMRVSIVETNSPVTIPVGLAVAKSESPAGSVWHTQQALQLDGLAYQTQFPVAAQLFQESEIRRVCLIPLTAVGRKLGAVAFARKEDIGYEESEMRWLERATAEVALVVDNHLRSQEVISYEKQLQQERDRTLLLLDITNALVRNLDCEKLFGTISGSLRRIMHHDFAALTLPDADNTLRISAVDFPQGSEFFRPELRFPRQGSLAGRAFDSGNPLLISRLQTAEYPTEATRALSKEGLKSVCCLPLMNRSASWACCCLPAAVNKPSAWTT